MSLRLTDCRDDIGPSLAPIDLWYEMAHRRERYDPALCSSVLRFGLADGTSISAVSGCRELQKDRR